MQLTSQTIVSNSGQSVTLSVTTIEDQVFEFEISRLELLDADALMPQSSETNVVDVELDVVGTEVDGETEVEATVSVAVTLSYELDFDEAESDEQNAFNVLDYNIEDADVTGLSLA
jgi:hypothetical protein